MSAWNFRIGALVALTLLAACGGGDGGQTQAPEDDKVEPQPSPPSEVVDEQSELGVSGKVTIVGSIATVNLDVRVAGEYANDAQVRVAGHAVTFDASHAGYYGELALQDLPASGPVSVEVSHGNTKHTRALVVPTSFNVEVPAPILVSTDFAVTWTEAAGATSYRAYLDPEHGTMRGGELAFETRKYTFNGLDAPGNAVLEVIAVAQNAGGNAHSDVEVLRIDRRTVTIVEPAAEPSAQLKVSGLITLVDGRAFMNLDVTVDDEWAFDAAVQVNGHELTFVAAQHGYYAEIPMHDLPASGPLTLEVTRGDLKQTRSILVPGTYQLQAPDTVTAGTHFVATWTAAADVSRYRLYIKPEGGLPSSAEMWPGTYKYTYSGLKTAGPVTFRFMAVTENLGDQEFSTIEVRRVERRTITVVEQEAAQ